MVSQHSTVVLSAVLAEDSWSGVGAWDTWGTEVSGGNSILWTSEEESVGSYNLNLLNTLIIIKIKKKKKKLLTSWSGHDQLIESEASTTGLSDSGSSTFSESESSNGHFWNIKKSIVVSNGSNGHHDSVSIRLQKRH